jgi:hypothetical protein
LFSNFKSFTVNFKDFCKYWGETPLPPLDPRLGIFVAINQQLAQRAFLLPTDSSRNKKMQ